MKRGLALFKQYRIIYAETDTTQNLIVKAHLGCQLGSAKTDDVKTFF